MWFINENRQVFELPGGTQEKRARRLMTRPEPTIFGNCDWLELHCRQKAGKKKAVSQPSRVVAGRQQVFYPQLINILDAKQRTTCA
ncbi:hypothetical protein [Simplicispira lacusdiani]|uniref:hypothetical protein n=1 Tax=Simplicispira lacusdiani TaxID=2213010 RepID=UPI001300285E|nr:hypothetical protein [Simplicispira lacusdiani]